MSYTTDEELCRQFIKEFEDFENDDNKFKYYSQLQKIANREQKVLEVSLDDVALFNEGLANRIVGNTVRYLKLFSTIIDELMPPRSIVLSADQMDALDVFREHRLLLRSANTESSSIDDGKKYPPELLRRFELHFRALSTAKTTSIRQITAKDVGHLVKLRGIVTRTSEVKPLLRVATYTCDRCDTENYQEVNGGNYMPPVNCASPNCIRNGIAGNLFLQTRGSKFVSFQEVKIQEIADQVPVGHIPRTITVHTKGDLARQCSPGDVVILEGIFLPIPYSGFQAIRAGLLSDTYLEAQHITRTKKSYEEDSKFAPEYDREVSELINSGDYYEKLANSIAPEIYGHTDVKKALLLLLVGGLGRNLSDGMKIRGDINICLMGDPGVAKSQLLRFISSVSPRGVYTTGKGSSGVGLTAAVTRDSVTGELVLEGGALVLADKGVCCIDEFDKMEESDRTSIHEVMEQQTISIAKAGITTTLNARTSILAAANPAYGRYDLSRSASANINLPAALLSRFDLLFLILDRPDFDDDIRLARHITYVHQHCSHPPLNDDPLPPQLLRQFIARARQNSPLIPKSLTDYITGVYTGMRADTNRHRYTFTSARTLLAILRLSTALARLRFLSEVTQEEVNEAIRLMDVSKISLEEKHKEKNPDQDKIDAIFNSIIAMNRDSNGRIDMADAQNLIIHKGFTQEDFRRFIVEYEELAVIQVVEGGSRIKVN